MQKLAQSGRACLTCPQRTGPHATLLRRMTDFLSKETRSRVMARIRSRDTKPELALRRRSTRGRYSGLALPQPSAAGKPDIAFTRWKVAVFVDGRFWHGHPDYFTFGKSGAYWDAKIARTQERDRLANEALDGGRLDVLRFWDFEVEDRPRTLRRRKSQRRC